MVTPKRVRGVMKTPRQISRCGKTLHGSIPLRSGALDRQSPPDKFGLECKLLMDESVEFGAMAPCMCNGDGVHVNATRASKNEPVAKPAANPTIHSEG